MDYKVSDRIQNAFDKVLAMPEVKHALDFIEKDVERSIEEQKTLTLIEAPTFYEDERAKAYAKYLEDLGLEDVHVDKYKNAIGLFRGSGNGPKIMVEAHLDTVFPFGTVKEVIEKDGCLYAPGIVDDTRGLAIVLSALRGLKETGLKTMGDVYFVGTAREEGRGILGGMKDFLEDHPEIDGTISIDGAWTEGITYEATGIQTFGVNFYGIGGHAYGAFGQMANPLHAAARAVAKIADLQVPETPKTTFCVSNFHAGNDAGIHAIVSQAQIKFNFRSNSEEELMKLKKMIFDAIQEACDEETARWGKDTITWDCEHYADVHAGNQDIHAPIVEACYLAARHVSEDPEKVFFIEGGSVNGNRSIERNIPCVTVGGGNVDSKCHSLDECYPMEGSYRCPQEVLLLTLLAAGIEGRLDPIIEKK